MKFLLVPLFIVSPFCISASLGWAGLDCWSFGGLDLGRPDCWTEVVGAGLSWAGQPDFWTDVAGTGLSWTGQLDCRTDDVGLGWAGMGLD